MVVTIAAVLWMLTFKPHPQAQVQNRPVAQVTPPAVSPSPGSSPGSSPAPTPTPGSGLRDGTYTGSAVTMFFGTVQVQIVVAGGRIKSATGIQMPSDRAESAYISQQAGPLLESEVISAQSAKISGVSGATYTSAAYQQSLQKAGAEAGG